MMKMGDEEDDGAEEMLRITMKREETERGGADGEMGGGKRN